AQPVPIDERLQLALGDETAGEKIEPDRLAVILQRLHGVHVVPAICAMAVAITASTVKPNFLSRSLIGADAPKPCMPTMAPSGPTYRSHPRVAACSTATRARIRGGSTLARYCASCCSNSSHDGMLTTRLPMPRRPSSSCTATQSCTSL